MPYKIRNTGSGPKPWIVEGPDGKVYGHHTNEDDAERQRIAITIHEKEKDNKPKD